MPADEARRGTDAATSRVRTGPRHAAPKKPLLTRLQLPAGKAIALAAMPTAVLMGMGLTPQLAQAKPGVPKNPFRDGPCVTAPDEQSAEAEQKAKDKAAKEAEEKAEAARKKADEAKEKAEDAENSEDNDGKDDEDGKGADGDKSGSGSTSSRAGDDDGDKADADDADADKGSDEDADSDGGEAKDPKPDPVPSETKNPLDPLGVGDALKDLLTPKEKEEREAAEKESPDSKPSDSADKDSTDSEDTKDSDDADSKDSDKATKPVGETLDEVKDGLKDGVDDTVEKAEEAAEKAEKAAEKAKDEADPDSDEAKDPMAPDEDGKKPFPCVVEKKVDGDEEQAPAPIPNQPWHLEASSLLLKGADYKGVVNLKMPNGRTKQALKYVISGGTDIGDLHQIVESPNGKKYHVQAAKGSTSTIRKGDTTMYTERISGNLFGLIPITFDPEHPPPLNLPLIYFTNVKVQQAGQFGGELTIPGLHQSITD
ncbi:hypothetical protein [Streptomyces lasiicapitis]|uniref:Hydrogenase expression protein HypF n=1 Tax=Streptomyces lasiicapitis TaxID=1923961 RepID=A0ABQ2LIG9_9ACTN|nr:hypothetical protein [Streptomyces lasiicapitis]GGO33208.1 hypothetical protein GCM10012286_00480 [Streptomyces lasiicapitis]